MCKVHWTGHAWLSHYTWASESHWTVRKRPRESEYSPGCTRRLLCNRVLSLSFPLLLLLPTWCNKCPCSIEFKSRSISTYSSVAVVLSFLPFSLPGWKVFLSFVHPFFLQVARDGWSLSLNVTSSEELPRGDLQYPFFSPTVANKSIRGLEFF